MTQFTGGTDLLKQALLKGLQAQPRESGALDIGAYFKRHYLEPIRVMYEIYDLRGFLRRLPLLSRRLARSGILEAKFEVLDSLGHGKLEPCQYAVWVIRSYWAMKRASEIPQGEEFLKVWRKRLAQDIADICLEYQELELQFLALAEVNTMGRLWISLTDIRYC